MKEKVKFDPSNLTEEEADQSNDLLVEYADVFALDLSKLGITDLVTYAIATGDSVPIKQAARWIPFALRKILEDMVQNMLEQGVIKPSSSPWSSPVVLVEKNNGSKCLCIDYGRLNSVTKMDVFPLPRLRLSSPILLLVSGRSKWMLPLKRRRHLQPTQAYMSLRSCRLACAIPRHDLWLRVASLMLKLVKCTFGSSKVIYLDLWCVSRFTQG